MTKYVIEGIGFNDGHPFAVYETDEKPMALELLEQAQTESPRISHRLVEVLEVREPYGKRKPSNYGAYLGT